MGEPVEQQKSDAPAIRELQGGRVAVTLGELTAEAPTRKNGKWTVRRGALSDRCNPDAAREVREVAKAIDAAEADVRAVLVAAQAEQERRLATAATPVAAAPIELRAWGAGDPTVFRDIDPLIALDQACSSAHAFLGWAQSDRAMARLCAVDVDVEPARGRFELADAERVARQTGADRAWVTRSGGLRLIFAAAEGLTALERAAVGLVLGGEFSNPVFQTQLELKAETRRPPGAVYWGDVPTPLVVHRARGQAGSDAIGSAWWQDWLGDRGLEVHRRYAHDHCQVDPGPIHGNDPVWVTEEGIWCHRCQTFRAASALVDQREPAPHELIEAARHWVHLAHARVQLADWWPLPLVRSERVHEQLVDGAWRGLLKALHLGPALGPDERLEVLHQIGSAMSLKHAWVRGEGGAWLHPDTFRRIEVDREALRQLPWTHGDACLITQARSTEALAGFTEVRTVRGALLRPEQVPQGILPVSQERSGHAPVLPRGHGGGQPWAAAFAHLAQDYPGIDETYLRALLTAAACVEPGGRPIVLYAHGPTGSGKTNTVHLAAGLLGDDAPAEPPLACEDNEDWKRQIGDALIAGSRFMLVNDCHQLEQPGRRLRRLLNLGDPHEFRVLHGGRVRVPWRSVLVLTGCRIPDAWLGEPEMARRIRSIYLPTQVPRLWEEGPPLLDWCCGEGLAEVRDALIWSAVDLAQAHGFVWDRVAEALGLPRLDEAEPEETAERLAAYRALYEHLCGRDGPRVPSSSARWPAARGWWDLGSGRAREILEPLMPGGDAARWRLKNQLDAVGWERVLGLPGSGVRVVVQERNHEWVGRAQSRARQGAELRGEQLPKANS